MFRDMCKQAKLQTEKCLSLDVPTRWNSTFVMLQVALQYKDAFQSLEHRDSLYRRRAAPSMLSGKGQKLSLTY